MIDLMEELQWAGKIKTKSRKTMKTFMESGDGEHTGQLENLEQQITTALCCWKSSGKSHHKGSVRRHHWTYSDSPSSKR